MKEIDFLSLDGKSLRTFLVVLEELSVSKAADRLGVTQSAVSHTLDKLRLALGDPLFVRSGRNIMATERAIDLQKPVRDVLDSLKGLTDQRVFDPRIGAMEFKIAANDFQRNLIFPPLMHELMQEEIDIRLDFIASERPTADILRQSNCQLLISPHRPVGPDIYQVKLFDDKSCCFYDPKTRDKPTTKADFLSAEYIEVNFKFLKLEDNKIKPKITVPNFSDVPAFLKGSQMLTTQLSLMAKTHFKEFAKAAIPFDDEGLSMYMLWHKRDHTDPAHQWLRKRIVDQVKMVISQ